MNFAEKLANVVNRYNEVEALISAPNLNSDELVRMNKELAQLAPVVEAINNWHRLQKNMDDAKSMMDDAELDKEMREIAEAEYYDLKEKMPELEQQIKILLLPKDEEDEKTLFLKSVPAPAATKPHCLRRFCLKCISAIPLCRDGSLRLTTLPKTNSGAIRRRLPKSPAKMFSPA